MNWGTHTKLREELLQRCEQDQLLRNELIDKPNDKGLIARMIAGDTQNSAWFEKAIEQYGWPTKSQVGEEGATAAFLLVQHSPNFELQRKCLPLMQQAVQHNEANAQQVALLTDRVLVHEGKKQRYGTQGRYENGLDGLIVPHPIEDEANVDARRTAIGLQPVAEYFAQMNTIYRTQSQ